MLDPQLAPLIASIVMVAVLALVWGGIKTWQGGDRRKGVLMGICALVILVNLLIWTL